MTVSILYRQRRFRTRPSPVNFSRNFEQPFTPQTPPFDHAMHPNEISGSSRSLRSQIFSPVRPQADEKTPKNQNAKKPKL